MEHFSDAVAFVLSGLVVIGVVLFLVVVFLDIRITRIVENHVSDLQKRVNEKFKVTEQQTEKEIRNLKLKLQSVHTKVYSKNLPPEIKVEDNSYTYLLIDGTGEIVGNVTVAPQMPNLEVTNVPG